MTIATIRPSGATFPNVGLFDDVARSQRRKLEESPYGALLEGEKVVDLFCGAGGWDEGAKPLGIKVDYAINHSAVAIATHKANNPECIHHQGDAWRARPRDVVGRHKIGVLFASAACTTHSRAKGSAPVSKRVHMLGGCIARWMKDKKPRLVEIENVVEWMDWGPLVQRKHMGQFVWQRAKDSGKPKWKNMLGPRTGTREGKAFREKMKVGGHLVRPVMTQDEARKGQHFRRFWRYCQRLGYEMEMKVLDAPDHGNPSRRKRLFIKARRDGMPILWPEKTHGPKGSGLKPFRTAADCIDWKDLGTSIFARPRSLRPKTLERIVEGIRRFVLEDPAPFLLRVTQPHGPGGGWHVYSVNGTMPTQTARQDDLALATPLVCPAGGPKRQPRPVDEPYHTVLNREDCGVATPVMVRYNGEKPGDPANVHRCGETLPTVPTENRFGVATPIFASPIVAKVCQHGSNGACSNRADHPMSGMTTAQEHGVAIPILATTGYGERPGQAARVQQVSELLGTCVNGVKQAVVTPIVVGAGGSVYAAKPVRADAPINTVKPDHRQAVVTPVLLKHYGGHVGHRVDQPAGTVTTCDHHGIATPVLMNNTSGHCGGRVDEPAPTQTTGGQTAVVAPVMAYLRNNTVAQSPGEPLNTVSAQGNHAMLVAALMMEYYSKGSGKTLRPANRALGAVPTHDRHGLVSVMIDGQEMIVVDILFRMLRPHELAKAMSFRDDFQWPKSQRATVQLIGNAVSPAVAEGLISSSLPRLRRAS